MSVLVITGTGTGVGKTIVTAAVAALALARGETVAVVKPAQTGLAPGEPGDLAEVARLAGAGDLHELARFPAALSPEAAARAAGLPPLTASQAAHRVAELAASRDLVLVEGAGGLLVRYHPDGSTIAGLAAAAGAPAVVVTAAGLGTLNHTALTLEALSARRIPLAGLVIGSWPDNPGDAERSNLTDLARLAGAGLSGALPDGAAQLDRAAFRQVASEGLAPSLGGCFDPAVFEQKNGAPEEFT